MSDTVYTDYNQAVPITAAWLNDINNVVYRLLGTSTGVGGAAPTTPAQILTNIGGTTATAVASAIAAAFASPPALGSTIPAAVAATTISASGLITPASAVGIKGTATNDSVQAGSIGEYITANNAGSGLTSGTPLGMIGISLTAGDWDVTGSAQFNTSAGATATFCIAGVSLTNNVLPTTIYSTSTYAVTPATGTTVFPVPVQRISLTTTTSIYMVLQSTFSGGTVTGYGLIRARRVR